jgi:hypothetical protein
MSSPRVDPMTPECLRQIELCLSEFRQGSLTEARLSQLLDTARASMAPRRQKLLYMQLVNTNPGSMALGMSMYIDGKCVEPARDPQHWPYQNVLQAIADGWRVISFPNLALLTDPVVPRGLGCEFVLEKWE